MRLFKPLLSMVVGVATSALAISAYAGTPPSPSIPGAGTPKSVAALTSTGALTEALALDVAQGRKDLAPQLSLLYNSSGGLGTTGLGWLLDVGRIEPFSGKGVQQTTPFDSVLLTIAGSSIECISVGGGAYRARNESAFRDVRQVGTHWEVRDASGTLFVFGSAASTQIPGAIWALDTVEDANGNTITIDYLTDSNQLYPTTITYTGNVTTGEAGQNQVQIAYETRPDPRVTVRDGVSVATNLRATTVSAFAQGQLAREYALAYDESSTTGRSLLKTVTLLGSDGTTAVNARSYEYTQDTLGWGDSIGSGTLPAALNDTSGKDLGTRIIDVNGDNFADVIDNTGHVWLGAGEGHFDSSAVWTQSLQALDSAFASGAGFVDGNGADTGTRIIDLNGDLLPDVIFAPASGSPTVYLNGGNGWALDSGYTASVGAISQSFQVAAEFTNPLCFAEADGGPPPDAGIDCTQLGTQSIGFALVRSNGDSPGVLFADVNGDGLTDILWSYDTDSVLFNFIGSNGQALHDVPSSVRAVYINNGQGFDYNQTLSRGLPAKAFAFDSELQGFDASDVNGDGLADLVQTNAGSPQLVLLGTGSTWQEDANYTASLVALGLQSIQGATNLGLTSIDYNGDGLVDYVWARTNLPATAYRNTGAGWQVDDPVSASLQSKGFALVDGNGHPQGFTFADVNGDGRQDIIADLAGSNSSIDLALGTTPDLLVKATSAIGEVTTVTWGQSSQFAQAIPGSAPFPLILPVVTQIQRDDGRADVFTTDIAYDGPLFVDGQFRGFLDAFQTDDLGNTTHFVHSQAAENFGQVIEAELVDSTGVRSRTATTYTIVHPVASTPAVSQIQLTANDAYQFDGVAQTHTRVRMSYDAFLQPLEVDKDGDVTNPNDDGRTVYTHAFNAATDFDSPISHVKVYNAAGTVVSESHILYDGLPEGQVTRGNPTATFDHLVPGTGTVERTVQYDVYGNPVAATEATGAKSTFTYDGASHTFRALVIDPLGRVLSSTYDPRFSIETKSVDFNGNATTRLVDVFGRIARETDPGDETSPNGTTSFTFSPVGNPSAQYVQVSATEQAGNAAQFNTRAYFDGFGQIYEYTRDGPGGSTIVETRNYDLNGKVASKTEPSYAGQPLGALSEVTHDVLGRPLTVTDPAGGTTSYVYGGFQITTTDPRGNTTSVVQDAFGHNLEHHELVGGKDLVTHYTYDVLGHLTSVTDPRGGITSRTYDGLGRMIQTTTPTTGTTTIQYDPSGRVLASTDAMGRTTTFKYNVAGDVIQKVSGTGDTYSFQYSVASRPNSIGRVAIVTDPAGTEALSYDTRGNVIRRDRTTGGTQYTIEYAYDSLGRTTKILYPDAYAVTYKYDAAWPQSIVDSRGKTLLASVAYDASGRPLKTVFGNGVETDDTYRADGALTSINTKNTAHTVLQAFTFQRDLVGNVTSIVNAANPGLNQTMAYDEINRLVSASSNASEGYGTETYTYDGASNFTVKGDLLYRQSATTGLPTCVIEQGLAKSTSSSPPGSPGDPCTQGWSYPSAQRPPGQGGHASEVFKLTYDAVGDLTQKNAFTYGYDWDHRLVSITSNGQLDETNVYDWRGLRVSRWTPARQTTFIDSLYETDASQTRRHVPLGMSIATTIATSGTAPLAPQSAFAAIDVGLDPLLAGAIAGRSALVRAGLWQARWERPLAYALILALAALSVFAFAWRATSPVQRFVRATVRGARGVIRSFRRDPMKWCVALLVVITHLFQINQGAFASTTAGGETVASGRAYYYHFDVVGNTNVITDDSGNQAAHREYTPFGEQLLSFGIDGPLMSDLSFDDHELDRTPGAQTYSFGARNYDPTLGFFTSADDSIQDLGHSPSLNLHTFAQNNPFRYLDANGHDWLDVLVGVLVAVVVVVAVVVATVATGGLAAIATGILIGAAIGAGAGAIAGIVGIIGFGWSLGQALSVTLAGAFVGALIGGAVAALALGAAPAATSAVTITSTTLEGAAGGAISGSVVGFVKGGSVDNFLKAMLEGAGWGAAIGFATGVLAVGAAAIGGSASSSFSVTIAGKSIPVGDIIKYVAQGIKFAFGAAPSAALVGGLTNVAVGVGAGYVGGMEALGLNPGKWSESTTAKVGEDKSKPTGSTTPPWVKGSPWGNP